MRYKLTLTIGLLILFSCKPHGKEQPVLSEKRNDTVSTNVSDKWQDQIVSVPFLSLVQHIDSAGYIYDTLRYTPDKSIKHIISGYVFFEVQKEYTPLSFHSLWKKRTRKKWNSIRIPCLDHPIMNK
jgi:hypothetical protein